MPTILLVVLAMVEPLERGVGVREKRSVFTPAGADQKGGRGWVVKLWRSWPNSNKQELLPEM